VATVRDLEELKRQETREGNEEEGYKGVLIQ